VSDAAVILGVPIGINSDKKSRLLRDLVRENLSFFEALRKTDLLGVQNALTLLRYSGIPRLNYLTRTFDPDLAAETFGEFDSQILSTAASILKIPELVDQSDVSDDVLFARKLFRFANNERRRLLL
jgi:hypothetical protein